MTDAEILFNETHTRFIRSWSAIQSFRDTFIGVAQHAQNRLQKNTKALFRRMVEDPQWDGALINTGPEAGNLDEGMLNAAADGILQSSYASLDAAILIFWHSVLDAMVLDYCRVTSLVAPQDWAEELKNVQIPLHEVGHHPYDHLLQTKLVKHFAQLERKSILAKVDRLFIRCQPPAGWRPIANYAFNRDTIEKFDLQRHEIVHGNALGKPFVLFPMTEENLHYLWQTGMYFMGLVNQKYRLRLDVRYMEDYFLGKQTSPRTH